MTFKSLIIFLVLMSPTLGFSAKVKNMTKMQRFYYDLGQKSKKEEFIRVGYKKAVKDFKGMVSKYRKKVAAYEAGKYLIEEGKITYPKVYKIREGNSYRIKITTPKVEQKFSAEDLFIVPLMDGKGRVHTSSRSSSGVVGRVVKKVHRTTEIDTPDNKPMSKSKVVKKANPNSFDLPNLNTMVRYGKRPSSPGVIKQSLTMDIPYKSTQVANFLSIFGSKYVETKKGYRVSFSNSREKKKFCRELSGDSTCKRLYK